MFKKCISLVLVLIFSGALCLSAAADVVQSGEVLIAVNTDLSMTSLVPASFSVDGADASSPSYMTENIDSGSQMIHLTDPSQEPLYSDFPSEALMNTVTEPKRDYQPVTITSFLNTPIQMTCLYVGDHCTVWGCADDKANYNGDTFFIMLSADNAKSIGKHFDQHFATMSEAFGSYFYDSDRDEKIAIMCYDIDGNGKAYSNPFSGQYHAGLFYSYNMTQEDIDCIQIDTYPLMGYYDRESGSFTNVANAYGTLYHEYQHLLNYSNRYLNKTWKYIQTDAFINEAFSAAAEHLIGQEEPDVFEHLQQQRLYYFNNTAKYTPGTSLTRWVDGDLSRYSIVYLFGQYLRTRYGQLTNMDGNGFFKAYFEARSTPTGEPEPMKLCADLLHTTPKQLVLDFWSALWFKEDTGVRGFAGEKWADQIKPPLSSWNNTGSIYRGGAKYYELNSCPGPVSSESTVAFQTEYNCLFHKNNDQTVDIQFFDIGLHTAYVSTLSGAGQYLSGKMISNPSVNAIYNLGNAQKISIFFLDQNYAPLHQKALFLAE